STGCAPAGGAASGAHAAANPVANPPATNRTRQTARTAPSRIGRHASQRAAGCAMPTPRTGPSPVRRRRADQAAFVESRSGAGGWTPGTLSPIAPRRRRTPMPEYTLPDLPYDYAALEPHYSAQILELHHDKHHAAYVKGANAALEKLAAARENEEFGTINQLQKNLAFNLSGHVLHSLFWNNMSPDGGDKPDGDIAAAIDESFGTFE